MTAAPSPASECSAYVRAYTDGRSVIHRFHSLAVAGASGAAPAVPAPPLNGESARPRSYAGPVHLLYLDESGKSGPKDFSQPYYVLGGMIVH